MGLVTSIAQCVAILGDNANYCEDTFQRADYSTLDWNDIPSAIPYIYCENKNTDVNIIFWKGNQTPLHYIEDLIYSYSHLGSVYAFEYPSYGAHLVKDKTIEAFYKNVEIICNWIKAKNMNNLVIIGHSLGSVAACSMSEQLIDLNIKGLILIAPLYSALGVIGVTGFRWFDCLDNHRHLENINCPIAMFHGTNDDIVNISNSKCLYDNLSKESKQKSVLWEYNSGHQMFDNYQFLIDLRKTVTSLCEHGVISQSMICL